MHISAVSHDGPLPHEVTSRNDSILLRAGADIAKLATTATDISHSIDVLSLISYSKGKGLTVIALPFEREGEGGREGGLPSNLSNHAKKITWDIRHNHQPTMQSYEQCPAMRLSACICTHTTGPTIALAMGERGVVTRLLAPKYGGYLTFAALEGRPSAPGQPTLGDMRRLYRAQSQGPGTRVFGIVGNPVAHSRSPVLHNAAMEVRPATCELQ
eukprot:scaffold164181_cov37-Prasinocladus_malaysianus.AAC.1